MSTPLNQKSETFPLPDSLNQGIDFVEHVLAICNSPEKSEAAVKFYEAAMEESLDPRCYELISLLYTNLNKYDMAFLNMSKALEHFPDDAKVWTGAGTCLLKMKKPDHALNCYSKALNINPHQKGAHMLIAYILRQKAHLMKAKAHFEKELEHNPSCNTTKLFFAGLLHYIGECSKAVEYQKAGVQEFPDPYNYSQLLYMMHHDYNSSQQDMLEVANEFYQRNYAPVLEGISIDHLYQHKKKDFNPKKKKIRVGFVSYFFKDATGETWLYPLFENRNTEKFEYYLYHYGDPRHDDHYTKKFEAACESMNYVHSMSEFEIAQKMAEDKIDLAIDLVGHVGRNRLGIFAFKPAPGQASWFNYFGTTGLPQMDYLIADDCIVKDDEDHLFVEEVIRLGYSYCFYSPPPFDIEVAKEPPVVKNGYITFGCYNRTSKINDQVLDLWVRVLNKIPDAKLIVKGGPVGDLEYKAFVEQEFIKRGVAISRIDLQGPSSFKAYLSSYNDIDLYLDSFPYQGGTTTLQSFWMGVPVVSFEGGRWVNRGGAPKFYPLMGMPEYVKQNQDEFVDFAVELANDVERLRSLKGSLRKTLLDSPICKLEPFIKDLEKNFVELWEKICKKLA